MTTPTPTHWHCSPTLRESGPYAGLDIGAADGSNVALVYHDPDDRTPAETRANGRLIVTAVNAHKAMVDALLLLLNRWDEDHVGRPISASVSMETIDACRAAIHLATEGTDG